MTDFLIFYHSFWQFISISITELVIYINIGGTFGEYVRFAFASRNMNQFR